MTVLIYLHKEQALDDVERRYPAEHYVLVDDKLRILTAVKKTWGERVTTVFVRQGSYAHDTATVSDLPAADVTIERIGDLLDRDWWSCRPASSNAQTWDGDDETDETAARSRPEPLAGQHHPRPAR